MKWVLSEMAGPVSCVLQISVNVSILKGIFLTIKELYKKIDRLPETTRMERINQLLRLLSPPSVNSLRRFKKGCKKGISPEQFIDARNKEIKRCIEWEFSFIGTSTRGIQGLRYLGWDTDLDIDSKVYDAKKVGRSAS